jgi:hypothetical protein
MQRMGRNKSLLAMAIVCFLKIEGEDKNTIEKVDAPFLILDLQYFDPKQ